MATLAKPKHLRTQTQNPKSVLPPYHTWHAHISWRSAKELDTAQGRTWYFWSPILRQWEEGFGTYSSTSRRAESQHLHSTKEDVQRLFTLEFYIILPMGHLCTNKFFLLIWRVFLFVLNKFEFLNPWMHYMNNIPFIICINRSSHQVSLSFCCLFQQDGFGADDKGYACTKFTVPATPRDLGKGSRGPQSFVGEE